jgi:hypothetical protein
MPKEAWGRVAADRLCALCRNPVYKHSDAYEERQSDGSRRLFHMKRCWPKERKHRKEAERRERRLARLREAGPHIPPVVEHFVPQQHHEPATGMFDFTTPPAGTVEPNDPDFIEQITVKRSDGRRAPAPKRELVWELLTTKFSDRPFMIDALVAADSGLSRDEYQTQLNAIGKLTGRLAYRPCGPGYPGVYRLLSETRPLPPSKSFHSDDSLPHAKELGAPPVNRAEMLAAAALKENRPMADTPMPPTPATAPPPAPSPRISPLRARLEARRAVAERPLVDPEEVLAKLDEFEELVATMLDDFRASLRKIMGLDA